MWNCNCFNYQRFLEHAYCIFVNSHWIPTAIFSMHRAFLGQYCSFFLTPSEFLHHSSQFMVILTAFFLYSWGFLLHLYCIHTAVFLGWLNSIWTQNMKNHHEFGILYDPWSFFPGTVIVGLGLNTYIITLSHKPRPTFQFHSKTRQPCMSFTLAITTVHSW